MKEGRICPPSPCRLDMLLQAAANRVKHGMILVPYIVSYFHDLRFQVDHVWAIRGPQFANLKDIKGAPGETTWPRGLTAWQLYAFLLQVNI